MFDAFIIFALPIKYSMLSISNLSYYIGDRPIYDEPSLHIKPKDKIGLIGLNGTGKTTLLRIINNEYNIDGGTVSKSNDCTIGYLNQDLLSFQSDESILAVAMQAFHEAQELEIKIEKLIKQLETDYSDKLVNQLAKTQEKYETIGGYSLQSKAEEILEGIGFTTEDLHRPLKEFSGGWRMRVMLAKLLLESPSLLMLDEPTNHLDLPSIQWIENYLKTYEGAVIVVSHDRQFLDNTINKVVEVSGFKLNVYEGNYSFYQEEKALRSEIQKNAYENQQQKIKQTEKFIERFRAKATKARQVQSRVKALERMDVIEDIIDSSAKVHFKFNFTQKSGRHVFRLEDASKSYGPINILENTNAHIERGDKIALIGANGKGKSTLLRIIAGTEQHEGQRLLGHNVNFSFYAQHQIESLNIENDILEEMKQHGSEKSEQELRTVLGCFLFHDDEVFKKIKVLSGGEKSRVALAKTLISNANFLLLDEPTNHLDIQSVNILIQALQQYEGTFILVSHDRYFISQIATKIWYLQDHQIKEYPGTYQEYEYWKAKNQIEEKQDSPKKQPAPKKEKPERKSEVNEEAKKLEKEIAKLEKEIEQLETEIAEKEDILAKPEVYGNPDELAKETSSYDEMKNTLANKNDEWEKLVTKLDEVQ